MVAAFICVTPLQALIVKRIIEYERIDRYILLFTNTFTNQKITWYYNNLSENALQHQYLLMQKNRFINYLGLFNIYQKWKHHYITRIYFGSIDSGLIQFLVARFPTAERYSFDDGVGNILEQGRYHQEQIKPLYRRVIHYIARGNIDQQSLRKTVKSHYTIYPETPNIVNSSRLIPISLFSEISPEADSKILKRPRIKIFIGQPLGKKCPIINRYYDKVVESIDPDAYLPHPAETVTGTWKNVIMTNFIAEDYIFHQLQHYERIEIYSFMSSALLNLRHPKIDRYVVDVGSSVGTIIEYQNHASKQGCMIIDMRNICE